MRRTLSAVFATLALVPAASAGTYYGYNYLATNIPAQGSAASCKAAPDYTADYYPTIACSGFNYWSTNTVYKNSGDRIDVGFTNSSSDTLYYFSYSGVINNPPITLSRTAVGAPSYNRAFCGYHTGNSSYVQCNVS